MNVLQDLRSGGLYIQDARLGSVGPYPLYMESFETLVECNKVSDEIMDALFHLFSMKRPGILAINAHTLSHILDGGARARSHYFIKRNIFKNTREVIGPYLEHGNHWTFFFAETFLEGEEGYLTCPPVHEERQRLGLLLFKSLGKYNIYSHINSVCPS
ncbi:uncharacterized protein LOC125804935 isoform X2 [Astyanax mexicanus]|uniref:uncharacterized protein LOC111193920 isoform X2 n=1 Tax=Astyanax mexicanus TaxID=7994 RepID=UPI0020CAEFC1|nr:uncharacterized protein LOC111193920 isoform X2 [Astyanax mexicanus]XP_049329449.1 uncharacterized protein LOC125794055 isoform X2 [Astyanax mexicanus]XP_049338673.1 uncharacterized protein LOC125803930 isoform X2 [Astyanax mexicanus]XP_049340792.1 uncharacterized protein LOC125804935 isoform X2 [Astyanax mexicanus]